MWAAVSSEKFARIRQKPMMFYTKNFILVANVFLYGESEYHNLKNSESKKSLEISGELLYNKSILNSYNLLWKC